MNDTPDRSGRAPFEPPYTADDLPQLDRLHIIVGLGLEWMDSKERAKIAATHLADVQR